jgi:glutamate transport system permease protein
MSNVLIEALGPRGRRRAFIGSVVSSLLIAAAVAFLLYRFWTFGILDADQWTPFLEKVNLGFLFEGLINTIRAAVVAALLSMAFGFLLALGRLALSLPLRVLCRTYVELFRSIPLLIMIFAAFFGLPELGIEVSQFTALVLALTVYNSAVLAEIFRAGILSLDRGQTEAAQAIGLRYWQQMRIVILPQAVRRMTPAIVAQLATITKDTALGFVIGYAEFLRRGQNFAEFAGNLLPSYIFVAVIFFILIYLMTRLARRLEVQQRRKLGASRMQVGGGLEDLDALGEDADDADTATEQVGANRRFGGGPG